MQPVQSTPVAERGQTTVIHLHGETFGTKQVRALVDQLNENGRDGGKIVLAGA